MMSSLFSLPSILRRVPDLAMLFKPWFRFRHESGPLPDYAASMTPEGQAGQPGGGK
jgi:hypothetical protein